MAWTHYQYVLALTMVVTGSINTLSTKYEIFILVSEQIKENSCNLLHKTDDKSEIGAPYKNNNESYFISA